MNKSIVLSMVASMIVASSLSAESIYERFEAMEKEMKLLKQELAELKEQNTKALSLKQIKEEAKEPKEESKDDDLEERLSDIEENLQELNRNTNGSHLKFQADYRFGVENMNYKMADDSKAKNSAFMTNRLLLGAGFQATNNLSFSAQLAYNKAFGARSGASNPTNSGFEGFDWIANENAYDDTLRVRSAYLFYKKMDLFGYDIPWTFSIGRRPSTNGHLISLRDDDKENSPLGHSINVEFDGLSSQFMLNQATGTYVKFCAGRGMSNASPKFSSTPYAKDKEDNTNIDLAGLIFVPYDNKRISIATQYYYANNLIDVKDPLDYTKGFDTVGGLHSATLSATFKGLGGKWSSYLEDSLFFASVAMSKSDPKSDSGMFGSKNGESKVGSSFWIGAQVPSLFSEDGRWGVEYNHGSKYWRSITYGEDTNIGSKVAARGDAYEAYMTEYLVDDILSLQLRYTFIDYKYSGSNGFFGNTSGNAMRISNSMPNASSIVDKAQDIRLYLRYRY